MSYQLCPLSLVMMADARGVLNEDVSVDYCSMSVAQLKAYIDMRRQRGCTLTCSPRHEVAMKKLRLFEYKRTQNPTINLSLTIRPLSGFSLWRRLSVSVIIIKISSTKPVQNV